MDHRGATDDRRSSPRPPRQAVIRNGGDAAGELRVRRARLAVRPRTADGRGDFGNRFQPMSKILPQIQRGCGRPIEASNAKYSSKGPDTQFPCQSAAGRSKFRCWGLEQMASKFLIYSEFLTVRRRIWGAEKASFPAVREMQRGQPSPDACRAPSRYRLSDATLWVGIGQPKTMEIST